ncbi:esterase E4-like [Planococcus citri]|uniref:esterase E4-like n=1 Tax=Planococcus citri TaxID=170843 RepID=UPI0031F9215B
MSEKLVVTVNEGKIRGIKQKSVFSGTEYYSFFGVPYGKPPTDVLRFKDPVKVKPWKDIYDATVEREGCVQFSLLTYELIGTEDCLFNNIYTTKLPQNNEALMPVIVNIHPGAFSFGSPQTKFYGSPEFIMHNDIVYVCIAYRLHILGFLNLRLKECSGNQAVKDIVLSLRWIKNNVRSFGGDPDNVTLIGSSSGSVLAHTLILSPSAKGLFHKAVMMGGHVNYAVIPLQETNEDHAREIAKQFGYDGSLQDNKKILMFLKKLDAIMLIEGFKRCQNTLQETIAPIFPMCVFNPTFDRGDILPDLPNNLIKTMARIPIMIGFSQIESIMGYVRAVRPFTEKNFKGSLRQNFFGWGYHLSDDDVQSIYKEVEAFYLEGQPVEQAPLPVKMDIQSDVSMFDVYETVINPISEDLPSSVFVYKFEFEGNIHSMNATLNSMIDEPIKGTFHASDFSYWNRFGDPKDNKTRKMVETFTQLVTTFARTGNPNYENFPVNWESTTPEKPCYLSINNPMVMVDGKLNNDRVEFWERVRKKYARSNGDD